MGNLSRTKSAPSTKCLPVDVLRHSEVLRGLPEQTRWLIFLLEAFLCLYWTIFVTLVSLERNTCREATHWSRCVPLVSSSWAELRALLLKLFPKLSYIYLTAKSPFVTFSLSLSLSLGSILWLPPEFQPGAVGPFSLISLVCLVVMSSDGVSR